MAATRYSMKDDTTGTWSVLGAAAEDVAEMLGAVLTGLGKELADDIADPQNPLEICTAGVSGISA
ncbi:hypothetical protein G6L99_30530 [Agrobacterium rhizogenes]|uniref:hypothetical protein n=1 Tax=Rhizobium rhizogenes TaxID=359 RepID=UPI001571823C|nr:hypothetical protein [Rhizobium rhizogenes]NTH16456.1 hypothetical protein [Rhizobium rhizogenes]NTI78421.1 hypothetical protein [Rhizobium rhizogenes]